MMQDNDLPQIGTPMQTDETRAREVLAATVPISISSTWTAEEERQIIRAMLAFAALPAVERALHPALPLIEAIAKWERENGTLAAIMPSEYGDFCRLMADAAVHGSARAVTLHPSDREAIAKIIDPYIVDDGSHISYMAAQIALEKADAILALSGSSAPANPTEKGEK